MFFFAKFILGAHVGLFTRFCNGNHDANGNLLKLRYLADVEDWRTSPIGECRTKSLVELYRPCEFSFEDYSLRG
jgi:hypothetical protein